MKTTILEPEAWKRVVEIEIPESEVDAAIDAKLAEFRRSARLPGFRQGKVPMAVIKQRYGQAARAEAVDEAMQSAFKAACEEHKIMPACESRLTDMKGGEGGEALRFTVETEIDPPVEITGYDKLKIKTKPVKVTDAMVDEAFDEFVGRYAEFEEVGRPSKKGDFLRIRYKGVVIDGVDRPDLKDHCPEYPIELGGEGVFKEFDKGLAGKSAGEVAEISVKFPKDYGDSGVAGKTGVFSVEVLSVQEKQLPELNDGFFRKICAGGTADALKGELRKSIEAEMLRDAKEAAQNEAIQTLIESNKIEVAPSTVSALAARTVEEQRKQGNKAMEGELSDEMWAHIITLAEHTVKRMKVIKYVADKEKIKATQEEVDDEIRQMAQYYGYSFEELKQQLRTSGGTNRIREEISDRKTLDFLIGENHTV